MLCSLSETVRLIVLTMSGKRLTDSELCRDWKRHKMECEQETTMIEPIVRERKSEELVGQSDLIGEAIRQAAMSVANDYESGWAFEVGYM